MSSSTSVAVLAAGVDRDAELADRQPAWGRAGLRISGEIAGQHYSVDVHCRSFPGQLRLSAESRHEAGGNRVSMRKMGGKVAGATQGVAGSWQKATPRGPMGRRGGPARGSGGRRGLGPGAVVGAGLARGWGGAAA